MTGKDNFTPILILHKKLYCSKNYSKMTNKVKMRKFYPYTLLHKFDNTRQMGKLTPK